MRKFNIVIAGVGGQGIISLASILAEAALKQKLDVKTSEVHGLSQRMGSVESHVRIDKKVYSSLVVKGQANLVFGLEPLEALRAASYGSKENKTAFVFDTQKIPASGRKYPSLNQIAKMLKKFSSRVIPLNATEIAKQTVGNPVVANVYLLGYAAGKNLIPLKKKNLLEGIKEVVPEKYFAMNKKIFEAAFS